MHIKGNGIDKTFDKYSKEIDFILKTGENTIIQNNVNMQTVALSFINIREILQIYLSYRFYAFDMYEK